MRNRSRAFLAPALVAVALTALAAPTASATGRLVVQESFSGSTWLAADQACQAAGQQLVSQGTIDSFTCGPQLNPLTIVMVLRGYLG
jgi:hypothetical protein